MLGIKRLCKDYDILSGGRPSYGGTFGLWTIYDAYHKYSNTPASVFVCSKKQIEKYLFQKDKNAELMFQILRYEQKPVKCKTMLYYFEPLYEDSNNMVFVTERVRGCLLDNFTYFKEVDQFILALCSLVDELANLQQNDTFCGAVTPFNILLTYYGFLRISGFGQALETPYFAFYASAARYYGSSKTFQNKRDLSQALYSVISIFLYLLRPPIYNDNFYYQVALDNGCKNEKYVKTGYSDYLIMDIINIDIFKVAFFYPLSQIAYELKCALCYGMDPLDFQGILQKNIVYYLTFKSLQVDFLYDVGYPKLPINYMQSISKTIEYLVMLKKDEYLSKAFVLNTLLVPLSYMMKYEDMHPALIRVLIQLSKDDYLCQPSLFLLFEPLMIACTFSKYRYKYPLQANNAAFQCFNDVVFENQHIKYVNPYLSYYQNQRNADTMIPIFDVALFGTKASSIQDTASAIINNLGFFLDPKTGGRSHFYVINFLASQLSQNCNNQLLLENLAYNAHCFGDKNWCCAENIMMDEIHSRFMKTFNVRNGKDIVILDPFKPLTSFLVPNLFNILKNSTYYSYLVAALECLTNCVDFFLDTELAASVLPMLNASISNIEKYPKAMVAFCKFAYRCSQRCTGRTVVKMFIPRVFSCMYSQEICPEELQELRSIVEDIVNVVYRDVDQKLVDSKQKVVYVEKIEDSYEAYYELMPSSEPPASYWKEEDNYVVYHEEGLLE